MHPHLVTLIFKAMADAVPDKVAAAGSETAMLVTYGGADPTSGELYSNLILEGQGYGGKLVGDGWDVVTVPNSNCVVTPVEVYETRYPLLHHEFSFNEASGGAGRSRGGLGSVRRLELRAPMTFSCYHSSERLYPWGLFGGGEGTLSWFKVKTPEDEGYANFKERFGVRCAGKFTNIHLPRGLAARALGWRRRRLRPGRGARREADRTRTFSKASTTRPRSASSIRRRPMRRCVCATSYWKNYDSGGDHRGRSVAGPGKKRRRKARPGSSSRTLPRYTASLDAVADSGSDARRSSRACRASFRGGKRSRLRS